MAGPEACPDAGLNQKELQLFSILLCFANRFFHLVPPVGLITAIGMPSLDF